ncbi:hypothetical protein D3C81_1772500 [compost metagenome]
MTWTTCTFQHGGEAGNINESVAFQTLRVDFFYGWSKDVIDFTFVQLFAIFLQRTRVAHQIVRAVKLHRVNENAGDHYIRSSPGFIDQLHMTIVQVAHGGN